MLTGVYSWFKRSYTMKIFKRPYSDTQDYHYQTGMPTLQLLCCQEPPRHTERSIPCSDSAMFPCSVIFPHLCISCRIFSTLLKCTSIPYTQDIACAPFSQRKRKQLNGKMFFSLTLKPTTLSTLSSPISLLFYSFS